MFVILNWSDVYEHCDLSLALNEDGSTTKFDSYPEADTYARENLNGEYVIVELY